MRRLNDRYNELKALNARYVDEQESSRAVVCHGLPVHFTVENTNRCNLRCPHCQIHSPDYNYTYAKRHVDMDLALFEKLARETFPWVKRVCLTVSGEALMSRNFDTVCDVLEAYGVGLEINSNGTLLTERNLRKMLGLLQWVTISFDGFQKETFEKWRSGADYDRVVDNVKTLNRLRRGLSASRRPHLNFTYVLMRDNIEEFPAFMDLARELEADSVSGTHVAVFDEPMRNQSLIYHKALANECLGRARKRGAELALTAYLPPDFDVSTDVASANPGKTPRRVDCSFLWRRSYLELNGDVPTCCVSGRPVVDNLREKNFWDIWNGDNYRWMRASLGGREMLACCANCSIDPFHIRRGTERAFVIPQGKANSRSQDELSPLVAAAQASALETSLVVLPASDRPEAARV
ncbi:MAG: radical SAM/SPASM domain-containing protein [Terriglobia bacterium]